MAGTRICSIIGRKDAGKTTLVTALAAEFNHRERRVMTIKHSAHPTQVDAPGTDSWRHFNEGKAERVILASPEERFIHERSRDELDPITLTKRYLDGADIVLVEGFKTAPIPKVEVWRKEVGRPPVVLDAGVDTEQWIALISDDKSLKVPCRALYPQDTMWMQILVDLIWDRAKMVTT